MRLFRCQTDRGHSSRRNANDGQSPDLEMVQDCKQISVVLVEAVGSWLRWSIGAPIPPQIHCHHLKVPRKVWHSGFEDLHVDNLVERGKDNGRAAFTPHGEIRTHPISLDESVPGRDDGFVGIGTITGQLA